jgi:hypothetical protein
MAVDPGDYFELSLDELREVTRFALASAEEVLAAYEAAVPDDNRPRAALAAARQFAEGGPRSAQQRVTALAAHRAAKGAPTESASSAASAAGDAAASAYLHPFAKANQVGHILRASAHAAHVHELVSGEAQDAERSLGQARQRATPLLLEVLRRYPPAHSGRTRVAGLMKQLDAELRTR